MTRRLRFPLLGRKRNRLKVGVGLMPTAASFGHLLTSFWRMLPTEHPAGRTANGFVPAQVGRRPEPSFHHLAFFAGALKKHVDPRISRYHPPANVCIMSARQTADCDSYVARSLRIVAGFIMNPVKLAHILIIGSGMVSPAFALTGNDLHRWCMMPHDSVLLGQCRGYIAGSVESYVAVDVRDLRADSISYCFEDGVTTEQVIDVVIKWLKDNPKNRHHDAQLVVADALLENYMCGN